MTARVSAMGRHIVVVGGSLAGLRAAEALRAAGHDGPVTIVGDEPHLPYDRPPLSKQVLAGTQPPDAAALPLPDDLGVTWELGARATGLSLPEGELVIDDARALPFDGLVIATGASPRRIPTWPALGGVHVLRTLDDCAVLRAELAASPGRVAVVGAGFIGCEVAATARQAGLAVTMVEPLAAPAVRALGEGMGSVLADLHRDHGVDLRLGTGVSGIAGGAWVEAVELADGTIVDADVVVVGIGVAPNTGWLEGSGLALGDGVVCDATCLAAPGVVAAGDVARWPHPVHGEIRIEHWDNAEEQGGHAARTLLADLAGGKGEPFAPVPWFWSDQYDRKLQVAGRPGPECDVEVVAGSVTDRRFVAAYGRGGQLVAILGMNMPAKLMRWRQHLVDGLAWADALALREA